MERDNTEDDRGQDEAPSSVEKRCTPTREVFITRGDERKKISNRNFVGGEGEP